MNERERVESFLQKHPHHHQTFFSRPYVNRRQFFEILGAGVTGSLLLPRLDAQSAGDVTSAGVTTQNKAKNVIALSPPCSRTSACESAMTFLAFAL